MNNFEHEFKAVVFNMGQRIAQLEADKAMLQVANEIANQKIKELEGGNNGGETI